MTELESHYDILKVAQDAPAEVIRAAYRSLSQKYHPDKNGGNHEATRLMSRLNSAYSVLSDVEQRRPYDLLLLQARHADIDDNSGIAAGAEQSGNKLQVALRRMGADLGGQFGPAAAIVLGGLLVIFALIFWWVWDERQQMRMLSHVSIQASRTVDAPNPESLVAPSPGAEPDAIGMAAQARPSAAEPVPAKGAGSAGAAAESPAPAARASVPNGAPKASEYERLVAMLKSMGLGLHKLDAPPPGPDVKRQAAPVPSKPAEPEKVAVAADLRAAPPVRTQAARPAAPLEAGRAREESGRPALTDSARNDAKPASESSRPNAAPAASAGTVGAGMANANPAGASPAPRQAFVADARACPTPAYPKSAYRNGETGTVRLALLVGSDGRVIESKVQKSSGSAVLDKAAHQALSQCTFKPSGNGKSEPVWTTLEYVFALE
jgi:TonB family protein